MKTVVVYSYRSKEAADAKRADLVVNGYRVVVDEQEVDLATCDFTDSGGGECLTHAAEQARLFVVAGVKP